MILQEGEAGLHPLAYASRTLTSSQQGYAQLEKEMLAIVFGCTKFHVFGQRRLQVQSDHKPLERITRKPLHQVPLRLQRMRLTLQRYDLEVRSVPGKQLHIADYLSKTPSADQLDDLPAVAVVVNLPIADHKLQQYVAATESHRQLRLLIDTCRQGWPADKLRIHEDIREYWPYRDEIHVEDGLVLRSNRVIIPC